jgi:hypothetical protein
VLCAIKILFTFIEILKPHLAMEKIILLILLSVNSISRAQDAPRLEFFCTLTVKLEAALVVGETAHGTRRIIPIVGGSVEGSSIKGEIKAARIGKW